MSDTFIAFAMLAGGTLLGYSIRAALFLIKKNSLELRISERIVAAKREAQKIVDEATQRKERALEELRGVAERGRELDDRAAALDQKSTQLAEAQKEILALREKRVALLEESAGYSVEEAHSALVHEAEQQFREDLQARTYKLETLMREELEERAKNILTTAIQRLASPTVTELVSTAVPIDNQELKGKIIGKEGRNIRAFERAAGVELLVDEVPDAIVVSCFDPVRRAIAVRALEALVKDGRIQPARIEEEIEKAKASIHELIKEKGAAAAYECGVFSLDPKVIAILGRLHFRTSYGQNVLQHSIEMAHLAQMLAQEVGADSYVAKAGALVHDIGKALDHEFEGTHVDIGIKVLRRFGTDEKIITAMKSHHDDVPHESLEAVIVQTADMISGGRVGARRDTAELYLKRLSELEGLASRFTGVEKAYALQAGREIRIFVHPEHISDLEARSLARSIALNIESELRYPGQIRVTVIRETRIIDYAR